MVISARPHVLVSDQGLAFVSQSVPDVIRDRYVSLRPLLTQDQSIADPVDPRRNLQTHEDKDTVRGNSGLYRIGDAVEYVRSLYSQGRLDVGDDEDRRVWSGDLERAPSQVQDPCPA